MKFYAHSLENQPENKWEPLEIHLEQVADLAREFASKFGAGDWGYLAGLWHDLGKYSERFLAYLKQQNGIEAHIEHVSRVDHSTAGAQHAAKVLKQAGRILAYCIAGHHAGLADAVGASGSSDLKSRLVRSVEPWNQHAPKVLLDMPEPKAPPLTFQHRDAERASFQLALFTRMIFSCLVDADFLATEAFMSPNVSAQRPSQIATIGSLLSKLDSHLNDLADRPDRNDVYVCRHEILAACRNASDQPTGLFSLTVPTGGGKTLASLAFALQHAQKHSLDRVIYAIPFTSIIEQTADVFRGVFDALDSGVVLEHHSNLDPDQETYKSRLASENWNAPIVVTTNVQFFESLFASRTSQCRKLHRVANSVVILDEVQTLPINLLTSCLAVLRELATDYRCSIVLCTATQPAIVHRPEFSIGLQGVREIIPQPQALYERMRRVTVKNLGRLTDEALIEHLKSHRQFLCIVNTRAHAAKLFEALQTKLGSTDGLFHLSTLMCGEHRRKTLAAIRQRLKNDKVCCVISTQLVEAGVDLDFPVVYRALTGMDSIAQAAGRCNREGRNPGAVVYVFEPIEVRLRGFLASTAESAREIIADAPDLLDPHVISRYFELHYWKHKDKWDEKQIMKMFRSPQEQFFQFREAAELFRLIEETAKPVIVPWKARGRRLVEKLHREEPNRALRRQLQRYTVSVYQDVYQRLLGTDFEEVWDGCAVLLNETLYDDLIGLQLNRAGYHEPESLIVSG